MLSTDNETSVSFTGYKCDTTLDDFGEDSYHTNKQPIQIQTGEGTKNKKKRKRNKKNNKGKTATNMPTTVIVTSHTDADKVSLFPPEQSNETKRSPKVDVKKVVPSGTPLIATIVIPSRHAGQFIGKGGVVINNFRNKTGANVQLQDRIVCFAEEAEAKRLIKLKGDESTMADVLELISITMNSVNGQPQEEQRLTLLCPNENLTVDIQKMKGVVCNTYKFFTFINVKGDSADVADTCVDILVSGLGVVQINEKAIRTGRDEKNDNYQKIKRDRGQRQMNLMQQAPGGARAVLNTSDRRNFVMQNNLQQFNNRNNNNFRFSNYQPTNNQVFSIQNNGQNFQTNGGRPMNPQLLQQQQALHRHQPNNVTSIPIQQQQQTQHRRHNSNNNIMSMPNHHNVMGIPPQNSLNTISSTPVVAPGANNNLATALTGGNANNALELLQKAGGLNPLLLLQLLAKQQEKSKSSRRKRRRDSGRVSSRKRRRH